MSNEYITYHRLPTISEYKKLCHAVGWTEYMNFSAVEESLKRSLFGVVVQYEDETIGMGRVIGDGCIYFYIQDIAVTPAHQSKGIGNMIMEAISHYLRENAPDKSFIGLFASKGKEPFYNKFGLHKYDGLTGMFGVIHNREIK